jgi:hypothetical protein
MSKKKDKTKIKRKKINSDKKPNKKQYNDESNRW